MTTANRRAPSIEEDFLIYTMTGFVYCFICGLDGHRTTRREARARSFIHGANAQVVRLGGGVKRAQIGVDVTE